MKIQESFEVHRAMGTFLGLCIHNFVWRKTKDRGTHMHNGQALKAPHEALAHLKNFLILLSTPTTSCFSFHLLLALLTHHEIPPIYSSTTHPNTFSLTISRLLVPFPVIHPRWTQQLTTHDRQLQVMLSQIMI